MMRSQHRPLEKHLQETCSEFLALDGWRRIRTDLKQLRGLGVQEKGMADDLFIRYGKACPEIQGCFSMGGCGCAEVLWIEWKRERGGTGKRALFTKAEKAMIHQKAWHAAERARGALTWIAGEDFTASIEGFIEHYSESGLLRNQALRGKRRLESTCVKV